MPSVSTLPSSAKSPSFRGATGGSIPASRNKPVRSSARNSKSASTRGVPVKPLKLPLARALAPARSSTRASRTVNVPAWSVPSKPTPWAGVRR